MIREMLIHNIEFEDGSHSDRWVCAADLKYAYPSRYSEELSESEFFKLAIEYLDQDDEVANTDYAKIDYWR